MLAVLLAAGAAVAEATPMTAAGKPAEGETWPVKRLVEEDGFAYSSMAAGRPETPSEGWIYLLYETGGHPDPEGEIARFNLSWLLDGEATCDGELPSREWLESPDN